MGKSPRRQVVVIGLGQFGMALTRSLAERGAEVIAIDRESEKIQMASAFATEALCFDATDEEALARVNPSRRDVCVCATGDQSKEAAIICTALLRQLGAPRIIARANDELHKRILLLVGAHEVVNPEWAFGERFSNRIVYDRIIEEMSLGTDLVITEFRIPPVFIGHSLVELDLRRRYGVIVVAIRRGEKGTVSLPDPNEVLGSDDILVVVSHEGAVARLLARG
ncbi:MAG: potassium transporter TrkA [Bdellovibrionales bacterium GWB1_55_8]|nr:MAG: potassium transporter TrkA [Bdellovibrionales bacterium GWB1_55_8]